MNQSVNLQKSGYLTALIVMYSIFGLSNLYRIIMLISEGGFSSINTTGSLVLRVFWFVVFWVLIYMLAKRKRSAYWAVVAAEITRSISTIIIAFVGSFTVISQLSELSSGIFVVKIIVQVIILPTLLIWFVYKSKKVLTN